VPQEPLIRFDHSYPAVEVAIFSQQGIIRRMASFFRLSPSFPVFLLVRISIIGLIEILTFVFADSIAFSALGST